MKITRLLSVFFLVSTAFEFHRCIDDFANYSIYLVDNSTVRLDFTIPNTPNDEGLLLVRVSIKNHTPHDTPICQFMYFDGSGILTEGCAYNVRNQRFSVTRSMEESEEQVWELSAKLEKNTMVLHQLVEIKLADATTVGIKENEDIALLVLHAAIAGGVTAGVVVLVVVVVVVCIVCRKRAAAERVTYSYPHELGHAQTPVTRADSGYLQPVCTQAKNSHVYLGSPCQEEELPNDNFELSLDLPAKVVTYNTEHGGPRAKNNAAAAAAAVAVAVAAAAAAAAAAATSAAADGYCKHAEKEIYPEEEFYENTNDMNLNLQSEELNENTDDMNLYLQSEELYENYN